MNYEMHLDEEPFERIKSGKKVIEVRLFDKKRQQIRMGDEIIFIHALDENKTIKVRIIELSKFKSFYDLYSYLEKSKFGHPENYTLENQIAEARKTYSKEKENKLGVLGIHIELIN